MSSALAVHGPAVEGADRVLTSDALAFLADLGRRFEPRRQEVLRARHERLARLRAGERPDFLAETRAVSEGDWRVGPTPDDLQDRRVEITGPVDRKMIINALNSGASVFMADFEDATTPTWENLIEGQKNLFDAVRRTITFDTTDPRPKHYALDAKTAVLFVRPRGWHLPEKHMLVDGKQVRGSLFDFGLYFFHNAQNLIDQGSGPYYYLPKMEHHPEARLWNDVFNFAQDALSIERWGRENLRGFRMPVWLAWLVTFHVVCVAWVFFRAPNLDIAFEILGGIGLSGPSPLVTLPMVFLVVVAIATQLLPEGWWLRAEAWLVARPVAWQGVAFGALIVAADAAVGQQGVAPFIYFQF